MQSQQDIVEEASQESFPASDPPSFTSFHAGTPSRPNSPRPTPEPTANARQVGVGALCVVTGVWMLLRRNGWPKRVLGLALACAGTWMLRSAATQR